MRVAALHWIARLLGVHIKIGELPYGGSDTTPDEAQN